MWDNVVPTAPSASLISRDMPCQQCGHARHTYLRCSDTCVCQPVLVPGGQPLIVA